MTRDPCSEAVHSDPAPSPRRSPRPARTAHPALAARVASLARDDRGASLLEYTVVGGLVALAAYVGFQSFGSQLLAVASGDAAEVACIPGAGGSASNCAPALPAGCMQGLCTSPGNCFVAGTPVLTPGGLVAIETIREGDLVVSRDEATGVVVAEPVTRTLTRNAPALIDLEIGSADGKRDRLRVTPGHVFWTLDAGWKEAGELTAGEPLSDVYGGALQVLSSTPLAAGGRVYNFEVQETHTYFVGALDVWVHNPLVYVGQDANGAPVYADEPAGYYPPFTYQPPAPTPDPSTGGSFNPGSTQPSQYPMQPYTGSGPLSRWDNRPPGEVYGAGGFFPQYPNGQAPIEGYVNQHQPSQYISTTTTPGVAQGFGKPLSANGLTIPGSGYVYTMNPPQQPGLDVNGTLGANGNYPGQNEVAVPYGVPQHQIYGAQPVLPNGSLGPFVPNPGYNQPGYNHGPQGGGGAGCVVM